MGIKKDYKTQLFVYKLERCLQVCESITSHVPRNLRSIGSLVESLELLSGTSENYDFMENILIALQSGYIELIPMVESDAVVNIIKPTTKDTMSEFDQDCLNNINASVKLLETYLKQTVDSFKEEGVKGK